MVAAYGHGKENEKAAQSSSLEGSERRSVEEVVRKAKEMERFSPKPRTSSVEVRKGWRRRRRRRGKRVQS
jgi:hypothetical protein